LPHSFAAKHDKPKFFRLFMKAGFLKGAGNFYFSFRANAGMTTFFWIENRVIPIFVAPFYFFVR
jgi:hypothetical protein